MAGQDTVSGGTASVEIEGILVLNEDSVKAAEERLAQVGSDISEPSGRPAGGGKKAAAGVAKDVQAAAGKDVYKLTIDGGHLRAQIMAALEAPFKIVIDADVRGALKAAGVGAAPAQAQDRAAPQRAEPDDLLKGSVSKFGRTINELHDTLSQATTRLGQTFGRGTTPLEKMADIIEHFGATNFKDLIELQKTAGHPKVIGGRASATALTGRGFTEEEAGSVENALRSMTTGAGPSMKQSEAMALVSRTRSWMGTAQAAPAAPAAATAPTANAATQAAEQVAQAVEKAATPALDQIRAADKVLKTALARIPFQEVTPVDLMAKYPADRELRRGGVTKTIGEEPAGGMVTPLVNLETGEGVVTGGRTGRRVRGPQAPVVDEDPEATARAQRELGPRERANVRREIGGFTPRDIGGINVDLEPLLQAARAGEFAGLIRGEKTGKVARFVPGTEEEEVRARERAKSNRAFPVEGFGETARNINPTEAFWDAVTKVYDDEIVQQLRSDPQVKNLVSKSLTQGAAPKPLVNPQPPQPGQGSGERGGIVSASGQGFEKSYRAAFRLKDVLDDIKDISVEINDRWDKIGYLQGSGTDTAQMEADVIKREGRLADLQNRARLLARQADVSAVPGLARMAGAAGVPGSMASAVSPEQKAILRAASQVRDAQEFERSGGRYANASQRVVGEQRGLTEEEIAQRVRSSPTLQGKAAKELGFDVAAQEMVDTILAKFQGFDPADTERDPSKRRRLAFGREDENSGQVLGRAFRETTEAFLAGLPAKGRERKLGEQTVGDVRRGFFGERDKVIQGVGSQAFTTTETRGGMLRITNEDAERAANLLEAGKGRGRVAKIARQVPTGRSSNAGGVETEPDYLRPATALDTERQMLLGRQQQAQEARAAAEHQATQDAQREAGRRFPAPTRTAGPNAPTPGAAIAGPRSRDDQSAYDAFIKRSVASRMGKIPGAEDQSARLAEIDAIQKQADAVLAQVAGGNPLGLPYGPELPGTSERISAKRLGQRAPSSIEAERLATRALSQGAVQAEALDVLQSRTAATARSPYGRETGDIPTGAETSKRWDERGGMRAGEGGEQPAYKYQAKGSWETAGIASSAGTMHVIIAGQTAPVTVALAGGAGGAGGGGGGGRRGGRGRDEQPPEEPIGPMFGPPVPPGLFGGPQPNRTLFAAQEAFAKQYGGRDPLGTRRNRPLTVKRTAQDIALERQAREAAAEEKRIAAEQARATALTGLGTQPINFIGGAGPRQSIRARRDQETREAREAAAAAKEADRPFREAAEDVRAQEAAQRRQDAAARKTAGQLARDRRQARVNDPVGFAQERDIADTNLADIRGQNRAIQRRVPRRGFGASLTDLVTSIVGRGALESQLEAADRAQREVNEINQSAEKRSGFITQRRGVLQQARELPVGSQRRLGLLEQATELKQAARAQTEIIKASTAVFEQNSKVVKDNTAKAFAAAGVGGAVSAAAGSVQFALASVITAPLLMATGEVISASLEKIFGQPTAISQARIGLGEAVRGAAGRPEVGVATVAAQTGLSAQNQERIGGLLEQTGAIEAGNRALQDQINLFRLYQDQQKRGGGAAGVTQTLGGQFGTALGGTAPAAELISDFLREGIPTQPVNGFRGAPGRGFVVPGQADGVPLTGEKLALLATKLDLVNGQLDKNGESLINFEDASRFSTEETQAQAKALKEANQQQLAALVAGGRVAITNQQGGLATADEVAKGLTTALEQQAKPTATALLAQQRPQIQAQIQIEDAQRQFRLNTVNPQTFALAEAQRPLGPAAAGINTTGLNKKQAADLNAELSVTQGLYDEIATDTQRGVDAAKEFVSATFAYDPQVGIDFAKSLDRVVDLGKQITSIEVGVQTKQAAYSAAQFSYQLHLANRSLKDAKGLISGVGDSMGALERQIYNLQRESQRLTLGQSQRQINFQTAVAGFQAPGLSSEEAEARIEQAKTEANFAQKQLDIQKKLFGLGGQQFNRAAVRQVRDLERQIGLLEKGRILQLETAAAEKKIIALTKIQAKENKQVETFYESAVTRTGQIQGKIGELVAATGEAMSDVSRLAIAEFKSYYEGVISVLSGEPIQGEQDRRNMRASGALLMGDYTHAEGWMGTVNGATSFGKYGVAGEAGGEAVAIIRDPKMLASPSGGGGINSFTVIINNPVVKSDDDKRRLINDVKRALQSEASMLLPRRA